MASEGTREIKVEPGTDGQSSAGVQSGEGEVTRSAVQTPRSSAGDTSLRQESDPPSQDLQSMGLPTCVMSQVSGDESPYIRTIQMTGEGLTSVLASPNFTASKSSDDPSQIGVLKIRLPSGQEALVKVQDGSINVSVTGQTTEDSMARTTTPLSGIVQGSNVASEEGNTLRDGTHQVRAAASETTVQGAGDSISALNEEINVEEVSGAGGDGVLTGGGSGAVPKVKPTSTVEPAFSEFRTRNLENPNEVYARALLDARRAARDENIELNDQRREQLLTLSEQYDADLHRKAAEYAAFCVRTDAELERKQHANKVRHLRGQLESLRNTDVAELARSSGEISSPPSTQRSTASHTFTREELQTQLSSVQSSPGFNTDLPIDAQIIAAAAAATPVQGGQMRILQSTPGLNTSLPVNIRDEGRRTPPPPPGRSSEDTYVSSRRRSPRVHASTRSLDVNVPQARALSLPPPMTSHTRPAATFTQLGPLAASTPSAPTREPLLTESQRKRSSTEAEMSGLDQLFAPKRSNISSMTGETSSAGSSQATLPFGSSEYMRAQASDKVKKAKELDVILQEQKKLENKMKIKQHLDAKGLDVRPNPMPIPADTFCYNCSLVVEGIPGEEPSDRAAALRKEFINYIAMNLSNFTESWMKPICEENGTDVFSWLSSHTNAETKIDGLFVVLMAAFLQRCITIYSHCSPWMSDAEGDDTVELCFAGGNLFCSTEVAEETFWKQFDASLGESTSGLDSVFPCEESDMTSVSKLSTIKGKTKSNKTPVQAGRKREKQNSSASSDKKDKMLSQSDESMSKRRRKDNSGKLEPLEPVFGFEDDSTVPPRKVAHEKVASNAKNVHSKLKVTVKEESKEKILKTETNVKQSPQLKCKDCDETFKTAKELSKHDCPVINCSFCTGMRFENEDTFLKHVHDVHHYCNYDDCDYYFDSANGLKYHINTVHNAQPVYPCQHCLRVFRSNVSVTNHLPKCKKVQKAENCMCKYCKAPFNSTNEKTTHENDCSQNPANVVICKICQDHFTSLAELKQHLVNVHGQGLFLCQHCHHGFDSANLLLAHQKKCKISNATVPSEKDDHESGEETEQKAEHRTRSKGPPQI